MLILLPNNDSSLLKLEIKHGKAMKQNQ